MNEKPPKVYLETLGNLRAHSRRPFHHLSRNAHLGKNCHLFVSGILSKFESLRKVQQGWIKNHNNSLFFVEYIFSLRKVGAKRLICVGTFPNHALILTWWCLQNLKHNWIIIKYKMENWTCWYAWKRLPGPKK